MDPASAKALRDYVGAGGTAIMTAFSAKVDEHGQWFDTALPGLLSDVFGMKTNAFYSAWQPLKFDLNDKSIDSGANHYEVLEPSTAMVLSRFTNTADHTPAVTLNKFGKGTAIYLATESKASALGPVLDYAYKLAGVSPGPQTPDGVYARLVEGHTLYVNTTGEERRVVVAGRKRGLVSHRMYDGVLVLGPMEAELIE
jgi:beta-galactosidase